MSYNTKNYTEQGGEKTVIGGALEFLPGAVVTGLAGAGAAFTPAENQAASSASDLAGAVADLNALLAKLKAAGLMAADA